MRSWSKTIRVLMLVAIASGSGSANGSAYDQEGKTRMFQLMIGIALKDIHDFEKIDVWVPVPQSNAAQEVVVINHSLPSSSYQTTRDRKFGNSMLHFSVDPALGRFAFQTAYAIQRKEWRTDFEAKHSTPTSSELSAQQRQLFLEPNRLVPIEGKPLGLLPSFDSAATAIQRARKIYDRVDSHVSYDKSTTGYGHGDVLWVCDSRTGNCTDFHSLFISLARSQEIPARFEIGFSLPAERGSGALGGYHCWAWFYGQHQGWTPVDISEADKHPELKDYYFGNLTENRVGISIGRDIILEPSQTGPPLNYFVHPYVEADGKQMGEKHLSWEYEYEDQ